MNLPENSVIFKKIQLINLNLLCLMVKQKFVNRTDLTLDPCSHINYGPFYDNPSVVNTGPQALLRGTNTRNVAFTIKIFSMSVGKMTCKIYSVPPEIYHSVFLLRMSCIC